MSKSGYFLLFDLKVRKWLEANGEKKRRTMKGEKAVSGGPNRVFF